MCYRGVFVSSKLALSKPSATLLFLPLRLRELHYSERVRYAICWIPTHFTLHSSWPMQSLLTRGKTLPEASTVRCEVPFIFRMLDRVLFGDCVRSPSMLGRVLFDDCVRSPSMLGRVLFGDCVRSPSRKKNFTAPFPRYLCKCQKYCGWIPWLLVPSL